MQWRRKPDGRPYADLRDIGRGRVSLLTKAVLKEHGPCPPDDVCEALYRVMVVKLGTVLGGQPAQKHYDIPGLVAWYVNVYKGGACEGTRAAAKYHLLRWETWCKKRGISMPNEFDSVKAQEYGTDLTATCKGGSARTYLNAVKTMFRVAVESGILQESPVRKWPKASKAEIVVRSYTPEQLREVLAAVREHQPDYSPIITFIAASAWSAGDAASLRHDNIDMMRKVANRNRKKTKVPMLLPLNATAIEAIKAARTFTGLVFPGKGGKPMHPHAVYLGLQRAVKAAGIKYTCTLHMFRHTLAIELTRRGTPLAVVAQILGHDPRTTMAYYQAYAPGSGAPYLDGWDATLRGDAEVCHPNVTPFPQSK